jgi:hypothetical protein
VLSWRLCSAPAQTSDGVTSIFSAESVIPSWNPSCLPVAMPLEIVTGRALAFCVHPLSAWHRLPASGRVLLVAAYVSASYAIVLLTLFIV